MEQTNNPLRFFSGSSTPAGFWGAASQLYDPFDGWRVYLLKGGAGSGKSTFLKNVTARAGDEAEVFYCSADPQSLDAVRVPSKKLFVLDATAPHAVEPQLWGACEQLVPLSLCADETLLYEQRESLVRLAREKEACHRRCRRLLGSAASLLSENRRAVREGLDERALASVATNLAKQEWSRTGDEGCEERRPLSAVTPDGFVTFFETVQACCPRIYVLRDEHGAAAKLLQLLKTKAVADGQHVCVSPSPLFPDTAIEHLWLPQLGTAFLTANRLQPVEFPVYRRLHMARFYEEEALREHRNQLAFREKTAQELLSGAVAALDEARNFHKEMEAHTAAATDWPAVSRMCDTFLKRMDI